jgi:hypothetical protein
MMGQIASLTAEKPVTAKGRTGHRSSAVPTAQSRVEAIDYAPVPDPVLVDDWCAVAAAAAEPNVFAAPWLAMAGLAHITTAGLVTLAVGRDNDGGMIGVAPMTRTARLGRIPLACSALWTHPNNFLTSAVATSGREGDFWHALISGSDLHRGARALWVDGLIEGGTLHRGLLDAVDMLGLPVAVEGRVTRAMLATDLSAEAYWDQAVRPKKRKELRRQWARLAETGALVTDHLPADADPAPWIAEFLALEAGGWKGANRSALASHADTKGFFTAAMTAGHARSAVAMTALRIDGRAIAMLVTLLSGNAGFSFKTAFDEDYARFSPGVLLQRESLMMLGARKLDFIDSCAAQDHPMIDSLWRERRTVLSLSLPLPGAANRLAWSAAQVATRGWHAVKRLRTRAGERETR